MLYTFRAKLLTVLILVGVAALSFAAFLPNDIAGIWRSEDSKMRIKMYRKGNVYQAKWIWISPAAIKESKEKAKKNGKDPALVDEELKKWLGKDYVFGLRFDKAKNAWVGGKVVFPKSPNIDCSVTLSKNKKVMTIIAKVGPAKHEVKFYALK